MLSSVIFTLVRILQILLLLPMVGMLGYFMHPYVQANQTASTWLLLMFIISVIGCAWCLLTLFQFHRSYIHSLVVLVVDIVFFACFIAGVVLMDFVKNWNCVSGLHVKKTCTMHKVTWVFGIINIILFFVTAVFAWQLHHRSSDRAAAPVKDRHAGRRRRWV